MPCVRQEKSTGSLTSDNNAYTGHLFKTIRHVVNFAIAYMGPGCIVAMQKFCGVVDSSQPFDAGTDRVTPAQSDAHLVGAASEAAVLNLGPDVPSTCLIQPTLDSRSLEGPLRGLIVGDSRGRLQRQIDLPDYTRLIRLLLTSGGAPNQQADGKQFPHSGISSIEG